MIKRFYVISSRCYFADGTGGFSYTHDLADLASWLPQHRKVYDHVIKSHQEGYKEKGLNIANMCIESFTKL
ncbi:MAG: hypothetical protein ACJAV0_000430 [Shewanella sp.]|jgi:hypothetical protein